jgi:hypothetical protein
MRMFGCCARYAIYSHNQRLIRKYSDLISIDFIMYFCYNIHKENSLLRSLTNKEEQCAE